MFGADASIRITESTHQVDPRVVKLPFSPTVVAASASALMSQAQYGPQHTFLVYTRYDVALDVGQRWV